jgi:hypothetical protein
MKLDEFGALAETFGGDVERWPEARRSAARDLARSPEAAAILANARRLDTFLAHRPTVSQQRARGAANAVLMKMAASSARRDRAWWNILPDHWLLPAASLACSAIAGLALAVSLPYPMRDRDQTIVLGAIFDSTSLVGGLEVR